ncbi:MAG: protein kinase [Blastocatellia bacterium]|nr:protein kinase [Blastocatellia bacterium]
MSSSSNFVGTKRFSIKHRLGAGSFGIVYEAFDQEKNSLVALKVLHPTLFQEGGEALYRFKREFRALADLIHPNLVSLYELIADQESWFFTMELVKGVNFLDYILEQPVISPPNTRIDPEARQTNLQNQSNLDAATVDSNIISTNSSNIMECTTEISLSDPLPIYSNYTFNQPIDFKRLRMLLRQLVEGVYALHRAGKLHRDLKPSNVLVTKEGRVVVLDFGLVTELNNTDVSSSLGFFGTPTHMSPEQSACLPASEASDWYSVGVILYQALTARLPFTGKMHEIINQRLESDPPAPSSINNNTPLDLDSLCVSLLQRDPKNRPTGKEILNQLRGLTNELPAANYLSIDSSSDLETNTSLIGREQSLSDLQTAFNLTQTGKTVIVYLHGSSGMGKSLLVREFFNDLEKTEAVILFGRCYEQEAVPYKAVDSLIDTLSQYLKNLSYLEIEILLPRDILVLAKLFPVLNQIGTIVGAKRKVMEIPDAQELRRRAFVALRELLTRLADRKPLVLFIDDLHWGDLDSVSLLQEILQPPDPPNLLLIVNYRTEEIKSSPAVAEFLKLRNINSSSILTQEITLTELSLTDSKKLALALLSSHYQLTNADLDFIAQESGGSPFFLSELVRYFQTTNYNIKQFAAEQSAKLVSLNEVLQARISQLPANVGQLLTIVAVAGCPLAWTIVKKIVVLAMDEQIIFALLRAQHLIRIRETGDQTEIEIYHDRIRENIVNNLSQEELKRYHLALAEVLETDSETDPETLANHFFAAGKPDKSTKDLVPAANKAYKMLAFDQAARLYKQVLSSKAQNHPDLWQRLGTSLANFGRCAESAEAYLTAAKLENNEANIIQLQRMAAEQLLISGHMDQGLAVLQSFLDRVGLSLPSSPKRALLSFLYKRAQIWWRGLEFKNRSEVELLPTEIMRIDTCWAGAIGLGIVDITLGATFQAQHLLLALNAGEPYRIARALAMEAGYSATGGGSNRSRTEEYVRAATELANKINQPHALGLTKVMAGLAAFLVGEWRRCAELTLSADEILRDNCTGTIWELSTATFFRLRALYWLGDIAYLFNILHAHIKAATDQGDLLALVNSHIRAAYFIDLANDEPQIGEIKLEEILSKWSSKYFHMQHLQGWFVAVEIALYQNDALKAWELFQQKWSKITDSLFLRIQLLLIEALHLHARVLVALATIDNANSKSHLAVAEQKAKQLEQEKMPYSIAFALPIRAAIAYQNKDKQEASYFLSQAKDLFELLEMALHKAAITYQLGKISNNIDLILSAEEWMKAQKIKNPAKIANMLVPGFS